MTIPPRKNRSVQPRFMIIAVFFAIGLFFVWEQLAVLGVVAPYLGTANGQQEEQTAGNLTIMTQSGQTHAFNIDVADTPEKMEKGLMFVQEMPLDAGMLFVLPTKRVANFWMRNTYIPLDMIFIGEGGQIAHIHKNARPHDMTRITSGVEVIAVLEVNGGTADRLNIVVGDRVSHPALAVTAAGSDNPK